MKTRTKVALFDLDGIVVVGRQRFFSERLAEMQGIQLTEVQAFFLNDLKPCSMGKADLKEAIAPYLPKWKWKGTVEDLLSLWFESERTLDERVLTRVRELREANIDCYIATRQEKYRKDYLLNVVGLKDIFDGIFCTCDIGFDKSSPEFFEVIRSTLGVEYEEMLFLDDTQKNVDTAQALGVDAHFYSGLGVLYETTNPLLH